MPRYIRRPDHPDADEFGMIEITNDIERVVKGHSVHIISDEMAPTQHMADGKHYTSKAKFRQATRDAGCVEVGNETSALMKRREPVQLSRSDRRDAIRKAISQLGG